MDQATIATAGFTLSIIATGFSFLALYLDFRRFRREKRNPIINLSATYFDVIEDGEVCEFEIGFRAHNVGDRTSEVTYTTIFRTYHTSTLDPMKYRAIRSKYETIPFGHILELEPDKIVKKKHVKKFVKPEYWIRPHIEVEYDYVDFDGENKTKYKYYKIKKKEIQPDFYSYNLKKARKRYVKKFEKFVENQER